MDGFLVKLLALCALAIARSDAAGKNAIQSLDGTWVGRETEYWYEFPASVPGGVYSDMMDLQIIDDIFAGYADNTTKWVGTINWTYALNFTVDKELLDHEHVNLVFEGVDTFATVLVNDVPVGDTSNMFVRYIFDVKDVLNAEGNNTVRLYFYNAPEVAQRLNNEQLRKYRIPWECPPDAYRGQCHINMIRKMQASFSWDWGPSFPSLGIWKSVYLEAYDTTAIRYVVARVEERESRWNLAVDTYFANNKQKAVNGSLELSLIGLNHNVIADKFNVSEVENEQGELVTTGSLKFSKDLVSEWWPNGYGDQNLFELTVTFSDGDYVDSKTIRVGFRTVELVEQPLDNGATFYFKVNGQPIFVKGSNEIPINILPEKGQDPETIERLLYSARDANMNMLRVWGGGVYESDYFYEVADRVGIMIWQDFMFACSLYPANEEFLTSVIAEVDHNVKRIYSHPSIVVYSGNNENEGVLADNWYNTADNYAIYKEDYVALYIDTVRTSLNRISHGDNIFISSSPSNGNLTESQGWVGDSPSNQYWGDVHYYNYAADPWNSNSYPIPRFCSEYGYQSLPFEAAWLTATSDVNDLNISSTFMDWRQHHPDGTSEMADLISQNLKLPNITSPAYTTAFIYLSEVYQAQAIKVETEHYRRYRSYLTEDGRGYTMGALYWQLNDVWVAPTWSSIDYTGRWKMLHYFAVDFFANVIVTGHVNANGELQLYTVNDNFNDVENVTVSVAVYKYDSPDFAPVYEESLPRNLFGGSSELIKTYETDDFLDKQGCDKNSCFFRYIVQQAKYGLVEPISPPNYLYPGKLKDSSLPAANVTITSVSQKSNADSRTFEIELTTDNIALFVWLDSQSIRGRFSDNGFNLLEKTTTVSFSSDDDVEVADLTSTLTVTHLTHSKYN